MVRGRYVKSRLDPFYRMASSDITAMVRQATGKSKVYDLSRDEASRLIGELKSAS